MSLLSRIGKIAGGIGSAIEAPFGLIADFATAPWNDDEEFNGFLHTITARGGERGGQLLGGLFGPNQGLSAAVGAIPEPVRSPVGAVVRPVLSGAEWLYREGVGEPLSTAFTVGTVSSGHASRVFDPDTWREAYRVAQHRSPGQAAALGLLNVDVTDPADVAAAQHSDGYKILSGVTDAVTRTFLDPTVVGGKAAAATRTARLTKPITAATDFDKVEASSRFAKFNQALEGKSAAQIRDEFFPNHEHGAIIATTLADAGDSATRAKALRLFMGDYTAQHALRAERADIAGQIERITGEQSILHSLVPSNFAAVNARGQTGLFDDAVSELDRTQAELDVLLSKEEQLARRQAAVASITAQPRVRALDTARTAITRSEVFQKSTLAAPLRRAVTMRPHNLIDLNRPEGDAQIIRLAKQIGFEPEAQDAWRAEYMRAGTPASRADVVTRMEQAGIEKLASDAGMTADEIQAALRQASAGKGQAGEILKSRVYDGEGRSLMTFKDDADGVLHEVPLLVSQTANMLPLTDFAAARQALGKIAEYKRRMGPGAEIPGWLVERFYRVWKPSVLLRVGWPIRVVGDEQMRIMAKIGVMAQMRNLTAGVGNTAHNALLNPALAAQTIAAKEAELGRALTQTERTEIVRQGRRGIGKAATTVEGHTLPAAFAEDSPYEVLSSSHPVFTSAFETEEQTHLRQLRGMAAEHRSIKPDEPSYGAAWLDTVNNQIGRDPLARVFLQGGQVSDGVAFLRSPEGRRYASQIPQRRNDVLTWAGRVKEQVDSYTLANPAIMEKAFHSSATVDDLFAVAPDAAMRPMIHGQALQAALGKDAVTAWFSDKIAAAWKALGSVPTDTLSRHPFFDQMYRQEAARRIKLLDAQAQKTGKALTAEDIEDVARGSREYALTQTRHLLYDLQEQSDLAHTLRFLMPFYSAWQETMTRWAGLAVENPAFIARMRQVWNAPEKAGLITDQEGNPVGWGDETGDKKTIWTGTYDRAGNKVMQEVTVGKDRYVTLPVPKWAQRQFKGLRGTSNVRFNKRSANLVLQGAPGFGPAVQLPVNEIVKSRPDLAESLKAVLPFGAQQSTLGALLPATVKRLDARMAGDEDRSFHNAAMRLYFDQVTDYNLGKRPDKPTWEGALKQARSFYNIRAVASFISPVAPGFQSPYQPYIDAYRRMRAADPQTADQKFLDNYGQEYFALTQALSRTVDGVPPTVEAYGARSKYKDLIEKHPDLGGLIVGAEGAGAFSNSVYQAQLASKVAPGSEHNQRETLSFEEASVKPDVRLGWIEYGKAMDLITAAQQNAGLPNLRVKGAAGLAALKTAITQKLMQDHPDWAAEFQQQDRGAMERRLSALRDLAADKRLAQRPEFQTLHDYFAVRDDFRRLLAARESGALDATSNTDIAAAWESITFAMAERNPAWAALYHRYLDRDNLEAA